MNEQSLKEYLLNKPATIEDYPFGPDVAVFKVKGKMFATLAIDKERLNMNLKCDPREAAELRDIFDAVKPGYHMNKTHWNTLIIDGSLPEGEIHRQIDNSYCLVVKKLKKVEREALELSYGKEVVYSC